MLYKNWNEFFRGLEFLSQNPEALENRTVFIRFDWNVPLQEGVIQDSWRIDKTLPTLELALKSKAKVIVTSHLGRPKGSDPALTLAPVGEYVAQKLNCEVILSEDLSDDFLKPTLASLNPRRILLIENIRFFPQETANDSQWAHSWGQFVEVYVNEAFGASHRKHASVEALARMVKKRFVGLWLESELRFLSRFLYQPPRPLMLLLGGAKISDKVGLLDRWLDLADEILIGGAMAYTFLKAMGHGVGKSRVEEAQVSFARELLERASLRQKPIHLPRDHVALGPEGVRVYSSPHLPESAQGVDIGPQTVELFQRVLSRAQAVFWNGPLGWFEKPGFEVGTRRVIESLQNLSALKVAGGGDTASCLNQLGLTHVMDFVSTGGGASLEFLEKGTLPGIEALRHR